MEKPPIGILPRWLHNELYFDDTSSEKRISEINEGIKRYNEAKKQVPLAWLNELNEIKNASI